MAMTARGYPTRSSGPGSVGSGTFGSGTGAPRPYRIPTGIPVPTPDNDNVRRIIGRSIVPTIRGGVRQRLGLPYQLIARGIEWYLRSDGDYLPTDVNTAGWTLACGSGASGHLNRLGACPPGVQLMAEADWDWGVVTIATTKTQVMNFFTNKTGPVDLAGTDYYYGTQTSRWSRTWSSDADLPLQVPGVIPARPFFPTAAPPMPWFPHWDPNTIPIAKPVPEPQPIPYPLVPKRPVIPDHSPNTPQRGPSVAPRTIPDPRFAVNPGPTFVWRYRPGAGRNQPPVLVQRPGFTPTSPPPKRVIEKKFALTINRSNVGYAVGRVFGVATEIIDFIDALYDALPKAVKPKIRQKYVGWDTRAKLVWQHIDQMDWNKAFDNLVLNEGEDRLIGTLAKGGKKLAQKTGRNAGFTIGPAL